MNAAHALDPIVATLASSIVMDGDRVVVPAPALAHARAKLRAAPADDKQRLATDLMAWAIKLQRLGGAHALPARITAAELALEVLGDETAARDLFGGAGLGNEMNAALGAGRSPLRAPRAEDTKPAGPPTKVTRGLRRS